MSGGQPANFLDIGGGASPDRVVQAFRTVLTDPNVSVILVNIFAGINRCDWVAEGVVKAYREVGMTIPVVVRLSGTNVAEGQAILRASGLPLITAIGGPAAALADAVEAAIAALDPADRQTLLLTGLARLDPAAYRRVPTPPPPVRA